MLNKQNNVTSCKYYLVRNEFIRKEIFETTILSLQVTQSLN